MAKLIMVLAVVAAGCWTGVHTIKSVDTLQSARVSSVDARLAREIGK